MPDETTIGFDVDKFEEFIKAKWGADRKCPYCESDKWLISTKCGELDEYSAEGQTNDKSMPVVPIICENCGHVVLVHPLLSRALAQPKKEEVQNVK
jgi:hypothetical protein